MVVVCVITLLLFATVSVDGLRPLFNRRLKEYSKLISSGLHTAQETVDEEENVEKNKQVLIVGAGPAGLLTAHALLSRKGYDVRIIDNRGDPREAMDMVSESECIS